MTATATAPTSSALPPMKRHPYLQWAPDAHALNLLGDKWTLLILRELLAGPVRFVDLQRRSGGISTEQLRSRLNRMVADGLLTRTRHREVPPRVDYELTHTGEGAIPLIAAAARYGLQFCWRSPERDQVVDIGALFNLAPVLVAKWPRASVTVELIVRDGTPDGQRQTFTLTSSPRNGVTLERMIPDKLPVDAVVSGTTGQWVAALKPGGSLAPLKLEGDEALCAHVVDHLAGR